MTTSKRLQWGVAIFAGATLCSGAMGAECSGRWTNVAQSAETLDLGKGHTLTIFVARGSSTSDNSAHVGVGQCGGYALTTPDGKTRVAYACARKNKDGDSWSDAGGIEPGADRGTWKQTGGTGVFAGKTNSGTWQAVVDDGKVTTGTWTGNCQ
jgi:hypothetical protein